MITRHFGQARRAGRAGHARQVCPPVLMLALWAAILFVPSDASAQCAMCRSLLKTPEGQQMVSAFRSGILLMLAAPFSIFAVIATLAVRSRRRREKSV